MKYFDLTALHDAEVILTPFPHCVVNQFILKPHLQELVENFPYVPSTGSYPCSSLMVSNAFQNMLNEFYEPSFRDLIAEKFQINLVKRPVMVTARGHCHPHNGKIHLDNRHKLITALLYMNSSWPHAEARLRILRSPSDLNDYSIEVPPLAGTLVVFKNTKNAWHGHTSYDGLRQVIQMNYIDHKAILWKESFRHKTAGFFKALRERAFRTGEIKPIDY